ncbi:phosphoribosylglycinamide formyltransferase [Candidatus Poribacteria bacterium]|nr:MAG: phosphoribosylglycinamide formyltransferase [Candidatus Poribacteria bacterium]
MKIAVLVSGSGTNLQTLINKLHNDTSSNIEIAVVISDRKNAYALTRAKQAGIPTKIVKAQDYESRIAFDEAISFLIEEYAVELIVLAGYMKLFQAPFVRKYRNRIINIHPSILPAFPGATPVSDSLSYGVKLTGVTVHFVDENVDTGPIIAQRVVPVYDTDSEEELHQRIQIEEHDLYPKIIKLFAEGKIMVEGRIVSLPNSKL